MALLEERNISPEVVLYLETPPNAKTLAGIIGKLGITPRELLRKGEDEYKDMGLKDPSLSDEALINAMVSAPKLIERPIVIKGDNARLGRPPEQVLEIL